jgi:SAM-dependent methyltransferase
MSDTNDLGAADRPFTPEELAEGAHRERVGGLWDGMGALQLSFLRIHGLLPHMRLLDVGCGSLRAGVHLVAFLDRGNYYGIDSDASLLAAGYDFELAGRGLQERLPRENLLLDATFAARRFGVTFDVAFAQSLFSHLPADQIRRCLGEVAAVVRPGASFFATWFPGPEPPRRVWLQHPGGVVTHADRDPYHYRFAELAACAVGLPWRAEEIGPWGHPRGQLMARFLRVEEGAR